MQKVSRRRFIETRIIYEIRLKMWEWVEYVIFIYFLFFLLNSLITKSEWFESQSTHYAMFIPNQLYSQRLLLSLVKC